MRINNTFKLIISLIIPQLAGGLGSFFTIGSVKDWYPVLVKPAFNPPAWVFGPVWTTLFALMGISLFLIWKSDPSVAPRERRRGIVLFFIQLVLNTLWSIIFFGSTSLTINGLNNIGVALVEIVFLWLAILATIIAFAKISPPSHKATEGHSPPSSSIWTTAGHGKPAAWLLVPYILWVSFAAYLNYAIWVLN